MPPLIECINNTKNGNSFRNGIVALSPNNELTNRIEYLVSYYNYSVKFFNSNSEIDEYITHKLYGTDEHPPICFALAFEDSEILPSQQET